MATNDNTHSLRMAHARYFAARSGIKTFWTGAVIYSSKGSHVSSGWSHYSQLKLIKYRSIHAEMHALLKAPATYNDTFTIYICTIRAKSSNIGMGMPCDLCKSLLYEAGIYNVYYSMPQESGENYNYIRLDN